MTVTDQFAPPVSESTYGYVTCRVIRRVGDTDEASDDDKPDVLPGVGSVRFTPVQPVVTSSDYSAYVVRETIDAPLDTLGHMVRRQPTEGETLVPGLWLVVGVYDVAFQLTRGSIRGFRIEVTAAHTKAAPLDLVTVAPYEPPPGATVTTMLVPTTVPDGSVLIKQGSEFAGVPQEQFRGVRGAASSRSRTPTVMASRPCSTPTARLARCLYRKVRPVTSSSKPPHSPVARQPPAAR